MKKKYNKLFLINKIMQLMYIENIQHTFHSNVTCKIRLCYTVQHNDGANNE